MTEGQGCFALIFIPVVYGLGILIISTIVYMFIFEMAILYKENERECSYFTGVRTLTVPATPRLGCRRFIDADSDRR